MYICIRRNFKLIFSHVEGAHGVGQGPQSCAQWLAAAVARISPLVRRPASPPPPPPVKPTYSVIRFRHFNFVVPLVSLLFRVFRILRTSTAAPTAWKEGARGGREEDRDTHTHTFSLSNLRNNTVPQTLQPFRRWLRRRRRRGGGGCGRGKADLVFEITEITFLL